METGTLGQGDQGPVPSFGCGWSYPSEDTAGPGRQRNRTFLSGWRCTLTPQAEEAVVPQTAGIRPPLTGKPPPPLRGSMKLPGGQTETRRPKPWGKPTYAHRTRTGPRGAPPRPLGAGTTTPAAQCAAQLRLPGRAWAALLSGTCSPEGREGGAGRGRTGAVTGAPRRRFAENSWFTGDWQKASQPESAVSNLPPWIGWRGESGGGDRQWRDDSDGGTFLSSDRRRGAAVGSARPGLPPPPPPLAPVLLPVLRRGGAAAGDSRRRPGLEALR